MRSRGAHLNSGSRNQPRTSSPPALDDQYARLGGYYLRDEHRLIHRHSELIRLNPDHSAEWMLTVDLELPTHPLPRCTREPDDKYLFLFPLVYLKKSDARTGFRVRAQDGSELPIPTRPECDRVTGLAAAEAANWLLAMGGGRRLDLKLLAHSLQDIPRESPYLASAVVDRIRQQLEVEPESSGGAIVERWEQAGLLEVLKMLIEHTLVWVPLRGRPGEHLSISLSQEVSLIRRPFLRWNFGPLDRTPTKSRRRKIAQFMGDPLSNEVLDTGDKLYGRRSYRISLPALGQRLGEPLAWMPVEFDFPTIYTQRCASYHFELVCPPGLTPRNLRIARGTVDEMKAKGPGSVKTKPNQPPAVKVDGPLKQRRELGGRTTLTSRIAHHARPGGAGPADIWFRVTVGVGAGSFPVLWFLAGAITALVLWIFAGAAPDLSSSDQEVAAGILLVVPALLAAFALGGEDPPVTKLVGGARILLLVSGLSAVMAAAVLIGTEPFHIHERWMWTACAMVATAVTVPLAASWLLSSALIWRQLMKLKSARAQYGVLLAGILSAQVAMVFLMQLDDNPIPRAAVALYLLVLAILTTAIANNRAAVDIGTNRRYAAVSLFVFALICLIVACIELKAAVDAPSRMQDWVEVAGFAAVMLSWYAGAALSLTTKGFGPKVDEIHVAPDVGRQLLAKERMLELTILQRREQELSSAPTNATNV